MKLNNKFLLLLLAAFSVASTSCKKNLDLSPPFQLTTSNAFNNLEDCNQGLAAVYAGFASSNYMNGFQTVLSESLADNVYETLESLVNYQRVANWSYQSDEFYMGEIWRTLYNTIYQANTVLVNVERFSGENTKKYNRIKGQALAARAIAHFDLLRGYANNLDRNSTDLGIPVKVDLLITTPARNTVKQVYDSIYSDLSTAKTLLNDVDISINSGTNKGFIDIWGAQAALARVALYAKDYPTAISNATAIINQFPLANAATFPSIWNDASQAEVVWSLVNNSGDPGSPFPSADVMSFRFDRNTFGILPSLVSLYNQAADVRFSTYYFLRNTQGGSNNFALQKFKGKGSASDNLVNFKVFRSAEMYLIRAEANANTSGNEAAANTDLNTLKTARIAGYTNQTLSGPALIAEIATERRRELAGEGHRWYDLKRTTRTVTRVMTGIGNANASVATSLPSSSKKWVFPIPEVERRANSSIVQNDGY